MTIIKKLTSLLGARPQPLPKFTPRWLVNGKSNTSKKENEKKMKDEILIAMRGARDSLEIMNEFLTIGKTDKAKMMACQATTFINEVSQLVLSEFQESAPQELEHQLFSIRANLVAQHEEVRKTDSPRPHTN